MCQTWKLNPELVDMQQFPHKFCRSNSHGKQDDIHGVPSKTDNIRDQGRKTQRKTCLMKQVFPRWRSGFRIQDKQRTDCFSKHRFSHKNCRLNWKTHVRLNQWHEFDESKSSNWIFAGTSLIRIGVGDLKQFHRAPILHVWGLSFELRRRMEIRNKLFQKISLHKTT